VFYRKVPALKVFEKGNPLGAFPEVLRPEGDDLVVTKRYASAFFATHLAATLSALGVDTLLICGTSTSGCVRASAVDACQSGFAPFVVRDACGDRHAAPHDAALFDLQAKYAEVIAEAEAIAHLTSLMEDGSTPTVLC
jgi:maleamate amidohydrolase